MASFLFNPGMSSSEPDLDDGSTPELLGRWTDGWSTNSSDKDDSNGLEELPTEEGDSGPADNEYEGWHGGGSNIDVSTEDHENLEKIMGEQFNSPDPVNASVVEDACASYVAYAKGIGFAVRKGDSIKNEEENIVRKFFYCNQQGLREKKHYERVDRKMPHKSEMRTNCNAKLVVFLDKICGKWRTETLVEKHNHDLVSPEFTNVMALHRKVTEEDNDEVAKTYEKRDMWENACLGGKFCAGIRTTSRCEGINSSLKKFIKSGNCLLELDYRNNEFIADYKTLYSNPVMTTGLKTLERSASKWYTREIFYEVQKQINGVVALLILHRDSIGSTEKFMFRKFRRSHHVYLVFLDRSYDKYACPCKLWERLGIPCCHIFCVLKELEKEELLT
ncbi:hypothetical protein Ahy_B07g087640 [Arachis hypogaea]|uniref:SWIM-type domain-containing protein n=1 Tax=Arachis hypogaea TaxID=3818 RepID=A0A444YCN4_ARAHY|nr:hypothetical protein Ahy_B07g087640 [Arachis hypogaea]